MVRCPACTKMMSTQVAIFNMSETEASDQQEGGNPAVIRKPKFLQSRQSRSSSQPIMKRAKRDMEQALTDGSDSEDESKDLKTIISLLTKIQKDQTSFKTSVKKDLAALKSSVEKVKDEMVEVKAKIVTVAPPVNLESELNQLTQQVNLVYTKIGEGATVTPGSASTKLESVVDNISTLLNKRKMKFFDHLAFSERHAIYASWETMDPPFTMAKYLPAFIENEPLDEYAIRRTLADTDRKCAMDLLTLRAERARGEMENLDGEVAQKISDCEGEQHTKKQLTDEWILLTKAEEEKSKKIWEKTAKNLRETPQRQITTNKVVDKGEGRTYAAVLKQPRDNNNQAHSESQQPGTAADSAANKTKNWNVAKGKNTCSHKENQAPTTASGVKKNQSQSRGSGSSFRKRGPKFKPKQQWRGGNPNQWNGGYQQDPYGYYNPNGYW